MLKRLRRGIRASLYRFLLAGILGLMLACGLPTMQTWAQAPRTSVESAQTLNLQGQRHLEQGNPQAALERWQEAEKRYRQLGNETGAIGTQLNQAKALQALGFYRRAKTLLEDVVASPRQPDPTLKVTGLLDLGNILRLVGEEKASEKVLGEGLRLAQQLHAAPAIQAAYLYLGNTQLAEQQWLGALDCFSQAAAIAAPLQLSAQLRQLKLLYQLERLAAAIALLPQIESQLKTLPPNQLTIYGQIDLADILSQWKPASATAQNRPTPSPYALKAAQLLATAAQQAKALGDRRAESHAIGRLGHLYEHTQQWAEAQRLTQKALVLASGVNVPEILYQWQWQMGRILRSQGNLTAATATYTQAVATLRPLRGDLVAIGRDVQYSFRNQVEPVYRGLVDLLLQPQASPADLETARETLESSQLAELNNFFREACLDAATHPIDRVDPTAAVLYPILLPDRLEVILSLPDQPLKHYATPLPKAKIEAGIEAMQVSLRPTSFVQERQAAAQQMYRWLVQPAVADLTQHKIETLVFVLDGSLRSLPMAALYDGNHYLIEQYQIALAPSMHLLNSHHLSQEHIHALVGGLSEGIAGSSPLPGVQQEIQDISRHIPAHVLLNQTFTTSALKAEVETVPFNVVHLATHGQFSSKAQDTYIQTWDGRLTVNDLQTLLDQRSLATRDAIELLVLSACETAAGDNWATLGMAGVAVRSGARSTLATLWAVNDASTAALIAAFYQALAQPGMSKGQAVRLAQLTLIQSQTFKHPFYWAPFILVGNWS